MGLFGILCDVRSLLGRHGFAMTIVRIVRGLSSKNIIVQYYEVFLV
jgi:hypothetical protein